MSISIKGLTKKFGETTAVANLDFEIADGEFLVLLGPSGCGKTTTMRCVGGLETPTEGRITIDGDVVFDSHRGISVPANKRGVGMVFQSYAIWPHMTVAQNVGYPLKIKKRPRAEINEKVEDTLKLVGLGGLGDRNASQLSGGQMQRVALARSIVMEPRVLLFDEPLSNLDAKLRDRLRFELRELQQRLAVTAIYVTHDQSEALALADRVAVMREGRFVQVGDPHEVYRSPHSLFVADFIGAGNLFDATTVEGSGAPRFAIADSDMVVTAGTTEPTPSKVHLCLRREHISLDKDAVEGVNTWQGIVDLAVFMGNHMSYKVSIGSVELYVDDFRPVPPISEGAEVTVRIDPEHILVLEE